MAPVDQILHHDALLLLTGPSSLSFPSLKSAYGPAVSTILSELGASIKGTARTAVLDILVTTPGLCASDALPRARAFDYLQRLLAALYKLLGVISASESIELDGPGGVNARVFFLDYTPTSEKEATITPTRGPIITLNEIAACGRSWDLIYSIDTPSGESLLGAFTQALNQQRLATEKSKIRKLPGSNGSSTSTDVLEKGTQNFSAHYSVAVGGTFDHLHAGHKLLLTATALALDPTSASSASYRRILTVGITGDELLVNKKYAEVLESWDERWKGVWRFFQSTMFFAPTDIRIQHVDNPGPNGKYVLLSAPPDLEFRFVQISDPFGPTITDEAITALVVSKETRSGGKAVNDEREKKGWAKLDVFEVDVLDLDEGETGLSSETFESKISSTEIRRRRMNLARGSL